MNPELHPIKDDPEKTRKKQINILQQKISYYPKLYGVPMSEQEKKLRQEMSRLVGKTKGQETPPTIT